MITKRPAPADAVPKRCQLFPQTGWPPNPQWVHMIQIAAGTQSTNILSLFTNIVVALMLSAWLAPNLNS